MYLINKYKEFLNESKIFDLLLEANIVFSEKFKNILSKIDSPVSIKLLSIVGKEVDINNNYLDVSDRPEYIKFIPDNRVKDEHLNYVKVISKYDTYDTFIDLFKIVGVDIKNTGYPQNGEILKIVKEINKEELEKELSGFYTDSIFYLTNLDGTKPYFMIREGFVKVDMPIGIKPDEVRFGRFINQLFSKAKLDVTSQELESFILKYKAQLEIEKDIFRNFKIVNGEDIRKYYHEKNYTDKKLGTLSTSCMRYPKCQRYLDIYVRNPKQVSLLILMSDSEDDKITGRALIWTDKEDRKILDRIYFTENKEVELFKSYAKENGWYYKQNQNSMSSEPIMLNDSIVKDSVFYIELEKGGQYSKYPYIDTFKYYNYSTSTLTNTDSRDWNFVLEQTNGGDGSCDECGGSGNATCYRCDGNETVECGDCNGSGKDSCVSCDGSGEYNCHNCDRNGYIEGEDGERTECDECDGIGYSNCDECSGNKKVDCYNCNGNGSVVCFDCNGRGETDCGECNY
jgi:hypothetical protein